MTTTLELHAPATDRCGPGTIAFDVAAVLGTRWYQYPLRLVLGALVTPLRIPGCAHDGVFFVRDLKLPGIGVARGAALTAAALKGVRCAARRKPCGQSLRGSATG